MKLYNISRSHKPSEAGLRLVHVFSSWNHSTYYNVHMYTCTCIACVRVHYMLDLSEVSEDGGGSEGEMPSGGDEEGEEEEEEEEERGGEANDSMSLKAELLKARSSIMYFL